jgi:hypothetical protein
MDPVSRLQFARDEINKTFGVGFAEQHPEVVVVVVQSAASDWAASVWPRRCWSRRRRSASCQRTSCCGHAHDLGVYS